MKAAALLALIVACAAEAPLDEAPADLRVNPYADVTIPPRDPAEELAQLQAEAPEGVIVELPPAGSMPAMFDVAHHADGTCTRTYYNGDGTPWVPPAE